MSDSSNKNNKIFYKDLKNISYLEAWEIQNKLVDSIISIKKEKITTAPNYYLDVIHPHTYTLGRNGNLNHLLLNQEQLKNIKAEFIHTNRGGDITYHGPEQIVGYPILDLENFFTDIHKYIRSLEEVVIKTIQQYGINGERSELETGVWIDPGSPYARKICAIGIKISRWVTMHGFSLNVNTNLSYFDHIIPCGIKNKAVTSMEKELGQKVRLEEIKEKLKINFLETFNAEWINP